MPALQHERSVVRNPGRIRSSFGVVLWLVACRTPSDVADISEVTDATGTDASGSSATDSSVETSAGELGPLRLHFESIAVPDEFTLVTDHRFVPGTDEMLVLSKDGRVGHYRIEGARAERLGGFVVPGVHSDLDCGLLSLAFDPEFESNRFLYVSACTSQGGNAIFRLTFDPNDYAGVSASRAEIFAAVESEAPRPWHNIGAIGFDHTGALWALLGDKRVPANGQDATNDLSALVRVIPNRTVGGSGHTPAPDNPFLDDANRSANVYAYGLRSPWRGTYDRHGRWWIGDVGTDVFEEINLVTKGGLNLGWAAQEGPCTEGCEGLLDPIGGWTHEVNTAYVRDDEEARPTVRRVVWIGLEYDPAGGPDPYGGRLTGAVLFGDFCVGFVRAMEVDEAGVVTRDEHLGHLPFASGWDRGPDGYLYVSTFGRCESVNIDERAPPPSRLFRALAAD